MSQTIRKTIAVVAALALIAPATVAAQDLPDARAVLARYVEITGAAKVVAAPGVRTAGTFELAAAGISGQLESILDRSGRALTVISIPGVGDIKQGTEPDFAWAMDPFQGPRLIEGEEFAQLKEQQDPKAQLRDATVITSATAVERTTMDGQACVKLKLVWKSGRETTECYSEATGLLVASESVQKSPMGDIPAVTLFRDYKDFDGTKSATKVVQQIMGQEQVITMTGLEYGPIAADKFVVPAEVKALRKD